MAEKEEAPAYEERDCGGGDAVVSVVIGAKGGMTHNALTLVLCATTADDTVTPNFSRLFGIADGIPGAHRPMAQALLKCNRNFPMGLLGLKAADGETKVVYQLPYPLPPTTRFVWAFRCDAGSGHVSLHRYYRAESGALVRVCDALADPGVAGRVLRPVSSVLLTVNSRSATSMLSALGMVQFHFRALPDACIEAMARRELGMVKPTALLQLTTEADRWHARCVDLQKQVQALEHAAADDALQLASLRQQVEQMYADVEAAVRRDEKKVNKPLSWLRCALFGE